MSMASMLNLGISTASRAESRTDGALALAAQSEETESETEPSAEPGPQMVPALNAVDPSPAEGEEVVRTAIVEALQAGGHSTAALLVSDGKLAVEAGSVRIEVNCKAKMIKLTFNVAAEKLIREALAQAGAPTRFLIVSGDGLGNPVGSGAPRVRAPLGSVENEARAHPLVLQAQTIFNAEIVSVVDLREK